MRKIHRITHNFNRLYFTKIEFLYYYFIKFQNSWKFSLACDCISRHDFINLWKTNSFEFFLFFKTTIFISNLEKIHQINTQMQFWENLYDIRTILKMSI